MEESLVFALQLRFFLLLSRIRERFFLFIYFLGYLADWAAAAVSGYLQAACMGLLTVVLANYGGGNLIFYSKILASEREIFVLQ